MNLNLNATTGAKEVTGSVLSAGIHKAIFKGITKETVTGKDGTDYNVMALKLEVKDYGDFTHNFFEPTKSERTNSQYGENPSQVEHFLIAVRQILDALDPEIGKGIDDGSIKIGGNFAQIVKAIKSHTDEYIDNVVEIKLLPQSNGYAAITGFPARITKQGALGIATRFIAAEGLVLTPSELKKIEAAKNAKPTNMASSKATTDLLAGMSSDLDNDGEDDLPF